MYRVDGDDQVIPLESVPLPDTGTPCPLVVAVESTVYLAYRVSVREENWVSLPYLSGSDSSGLAITIIRFHKATAHMFGPPNDEAFSGHPLYGRGFMPYCVSEVEHSSWISTLERMNAVHPHHSSEFYKDDRHFVFAFHDSTFECIARCFEILRYRGTLQSALTRMAELAADSGKM